MTRRILCSLVFFIFLFSMSGCKSNYSYPYDEGFETIERMLLDDYSDYLSFGSPAIDNDNMLISWDLIFSRKYIWNEGKMTDNPPVELMENIRQRVNEYIISDSESIFRNYHVDINFIRPQKNTFSTSDMNRIVGIISNYSYIFQEDYEAFYRVDYTFYNSWECIKDEENIYEINIRNSSTDEVLEIVDSLPNIQSVIVAPDIREELSELRPNLEFW